MHVFHFFSESVRRGVSGVLMAALLLTALPIPAIAALPSGFELETVTGGLNLPTSVAFVPDGRIFVAEKGGAVRVVKNGVLLPDPLVTLTDVNSYADHGLIGIAVDPDFINNGFVYLSYTYENTPGAHLAGPKTGRIVRVTVVDDKADESTKVVLVGTIGGNINTPSCEDYALGVDCIPSDSPSHSVGGLRFGPDGKLYATLGDGAHFDYVDTRALRAQNLDSLGGKVLRINTDGSAPPDNPFYMGDSTLNRSKVYAYGVRNMFRFNFRPSTGVLYAGDVGWNTWEEVNVVRPGANLGWPCREGNLPNTAYGCGSTPSMVDPIYTYRHDASTGAGAVVGGAFPSGGAYPPEFSNSYFFGDYALNWMKQMKVSSGDTLLGVTDFAVGSDGTNGPVEFVTGLDGNIYFLSIYTGELKRITYTSGNRRPIAAITATPSNGLAPLSVQFSSGGSNDPDGDTLTYLWKFGDGTTSSQANPSHTYTTNGKFRAVLTVFDGNGGQDIKQVDIAVGNQSPTARTTSPISGMLYKVGQTITLNGEGSDPEDGTLPASSLSWRIILHHNIHIHILETHTGASATFTAPDHQDPSVYTEIELTVVDSGGLVKKSSVNVYLDNNTASTEGNLIANPSLEEGDPVTANMPRQWASNWWGALDAVFTYPASAMEGARAVKVEVRSYTEGDAKWIFEPVFVSENSSYTFSEYYHSSVPTALILGFTDPDGTRRYQEIDSAIPPSESWIKLERTFTVPTGARTVTVLHILRSVGSLSIDNAALVLASGAGGTGDTVPPAVSLTSPASGATLSGSSTLTALASDNAGVSSVHFFTNGTPLGAEVTASPYTFVWDTKGASDGAYTLTAVARDNAGNTAMSSSVSVTVNNGTPTDSNLIKNPSLESAGGDGLPLNWQRGGWGANTTTFDYPITGDASAKAARVNVSGYTDGDAKWYFDDVPVTAGQQYTFSDQYQGTAPTTLIARFTYADGSVQYVGLANVPSSTTWQKAAATFTIPTDVITMTVFHLLASNGSLSIDSASLAGGSSGGGGSSDTVPPSITITAPSTNAILSGTATIIATSTDNIGVSGVRFLVDSILIGSEDITAPYDTSFNTGTYADGSHTLAAVARDNAGNTATSTVVVTFANTPQSGGGGNMIANPSVETASPSNPALPSSWKNSRTGTNQTKFTYPASGFGGGKAVEVNMTQYSSGHAEWYFNDVPVTAGNRYDYSGYYKSTATTTQIARYKLSSGAFNRITLSNSVPPSSEWRRAEYRLVAPPNATGLTVLHELVSVGTLTTDAVTLIPADMISPTVAILSPSSGATLSGFSTLAATATDQFGIAGVRFFANGAPLGAEVTASPYTFVWDTKVASNGAHTLTAVARDNAGNTAMSSSVSVTVNNGTPTDSNLIKNPSLESAGGDGLPLNWQRGGWGTNTASFDYPIAGNASAKAARTNISGYTSGDAKWYFDDVPVTSGQQYTFSDHYQATAPTTLIARFTYADGSVQYVGLANVPSSTTWQKAAATFTIPTDVITMTVFHLLASNGSLSIDSASLSRTQGAPPTNTDNFAKGMVSLTFDDGWISHYTTVLPMLNNAGLKGTFGIISKKSLDMTVGNQVPNGNLEAAAGSVPSGWQPASWGTNNATFAYPVLGHDSAKAARVMITSYTDGDAKWYFTPVLVAENEPYHFSDYYMATVPTTIMVQYKSTSGAISYATLATVPASSSWAKADTYFNVPIGTASMTIFHLLAAPGTLTIDDMSLEQISIYVNRSQVLAMQNASHEISVHSRTHTSLAGLSPLALESETKTARNELLSIGATPAHTFIYPYGDYDATSIAALKSYGFIGSRSVDRGYNTKSTDKFKLKIQQVDVNTTPAQVKAWVDNAVSTNTWLILMFHQVDDAGGNLSVLPPNLQEVINYLKSQNTQVVTLSEGIGQMNP